MAGLDLVTLVETVRAFLSNVPLTLIVVAVSVALLLRSGFAKRVGAVLENLFFTNWQLGLLTATGVVLSAASGWTTYIGIRNFTSEPVLAMMIAFGIQGVMLIVAWLIGESFATGMTQQQSPAFEEKSDRASLKVALAITLSGIAVAAVAVAIQFGASKSSDVTAAQMLPILYWGAVGLVVVGLLIVASKAHTFRSYFDAMRVMVRTAVLWVMFLACMAASVFFSFDSHFTSIFPQSERVRAAELRAQNQVAGVVSDIGNMITQRQASEAEDLFKTKGWTDYDKNLAELARLAQESSKAIDDYFTKLMEDRRRGIAAQQERAATAQSSQAGLSNKKTAMSDELARLKTERPALVEDVSAKRLVVEALRNEFDAKRVEAMAEERGVEGTGKAGQGPQYRARKTEESGLQDKIKIAEERLREPQKRLQSSDQRIVQIERELSLIDGEIAKLKGEAQTAESRIKIAEEAKSTEEGATKIDPARMLPVFDKARLEFRQSPTVERLTQVQGMCTQIVGALAAAPATKDRVRGIDCDPKTANEAASRVFALNDGIKSFGASCAGGDKLAQYKSVDALFDFARKCVQDSGLASKDTDDLRQKINFVELNRDDKANRFVVTWNAFQDGNRLAYLALAIAIAVDGLIFMSGLFAANAVRSPLSDVPTSKSRNAEQLEAIINNALLPQPYTNARIAIDAMHADRSRPPYTHVVDLRELDPERQAIVRRVLGAGASIDAVHRDEKDPARFYLRRELHEYLSIAGTRAFEKSGEIIQEDVRDQEKLAQLEKDISVSLIPQAQPGEQQDLNAAIAYGAQLVLDHLHPYDDPDDTGFRSELRLEEFEHVAERKTARRALTAGSNMKLVRKAIYEVAPTAAPVEGRYVLHTDFVKVLTRLRARMLLSTGSTAMQIGGPSAVYGGSLSTQRPALGHDAAAPALPKPAAKSVPSQPDIKSAAPAPAAPAEVEAEQIDREILSYFADEMGRQLSELEYYQVHSKRIDAELLERNLDAVLQHYADTLRPQIRLALRRLGEGIEAAYQSIPKELIDAEGRGAQAYSLRNNLQRLRVAMVLSPEGAYGHNLSAMCAKLVEDQFNFAADQAKSAEVELLQRHLQEIETPESNQDYWVSVANSLNRLSVGLAQVRPVVRDRGQRASS